MEKCDCLNECGDDPWLKAGKVKPCESRLKQLSAAKQRQDDIALLVELRDRMNTRRKGRHALALGRLLDELR